MTDECIPIEELARVAALPAGDPGRSHLEHCLRCRSLADLHDEFVSPREQSHDAGFDEADARLQAGIAALTGIPAEPARPRAARGAGRNERANRWTAWFAPARLRLAGAFAVLVVVGALGTVMWRTHGGGPVLREVPAAGTVRFTTEAARVTPGGVEFAWSAVPHATAYRVVFLDESLAVIGRLGPTTETHVRADSAGLPFGSAHGRTIGWEVEALNGPDVLVTSPARALQVP